MTDISLTDMLDRLVGIFKHRSTARKELFRSEIKDFAEEYAKQQKYLISEIDLLHREFVAEARKAEQLLSLNDVAEPLQSLNEKLQKSIEDVQERRHQARSERMALQKIAAERSKRVYGGESVLQVVSDEERAQMRDFFQAISDAFTVEDMRYGHDLVPALSLASRSLDRIRTLSDNPDAEAKKRILECLLDCGRSLDQARERAQEAYASVAALQDEIRAPLEGLK